MPASPATTPPLKRSARWQLRWAAQAQMPDPLPRSRWTSQMRPPLSTWAVILSAPSFPKVWPPRPAEAHPPWTLLPSSAVSRPCLAAPRPLRVPHARPPPPTLRTLPPPSVALSQMMPRMPRCQPSPPPVRHRPAPGGRPVREDLLQHELQRNLVSTNTVGEAVLSRWRDSSKQGAKNS
jgi:hypothetical protein